MNLTDEQIQGWIKDLSASPIQRVNCFGNRSPEGMWVQLDPVVIPSAVWEEIQKRLGIREKDGV